MIRYYIDRRRYKIKIEPIVHSTCMTFRLSILRADRQHQISSCVHISKCAIWFSVVKFYFFPFFLANRARVFLCVTVCPFGVIQFFLWCVPDVSCGSDPTEVARIERASEREKKRIKRTCHLDAHCQLVT